MGSSYGWTTSLFRRSRCGSRRAFPFDDVEVVPSWGWRQALSDPDGFERIVGCHGTSNQRWARTAGDIAISVALERRPCRPRSGQAPERPQRSWPFSRTGLRVPHHTRSYRSAAPRIADGQGTPRLDGARSLSEGGARTGAPHRSWLPQRRTGADAVRGGPRARARRARAECTVRSTSTAKPSAVQCR